MRKLFLSFFLLLFCLSANASRIIDEPIKPKPIFVSPQGDDKNEGTLEQPIATINAALRKVRELRRLHDLDGYVYIFLLDGVYELQEPIIIRPEDSGTESVPTIIRTLPKNRPIISGGVRIKSWQKASKVTGLPKAAQGKVWMADAPKFNGQSLAFRQLWVNDKKAIRAQHVDTENMPRILTWDTKNRTCDIPAPTQKLSTLDGVEMFILQQWATANLRIRTLDVAGSKAQLTFHEPESRIQFEHPWPQPVIDEKNGNSAFMLTNAIEFLDTPGEWYLDTKNQKVYYYPRSGEDMSQAYVVAPTLETLVKIEGTVDKPVSHISLSGITFAHTTWLRPSQQGHVPLQAGMYMLDAYKLQKAGLPWDNKLENQAWIGRQPAAIEVRGANNIDINCHFTHTAASALDFVSAVQHSRISSCTFTDIGGSAIVAGSFQENTEAHVPYNPADQREVCGNIYISSNKISDAANEDWGCVGISVGYAHDVYIARNKVSNLPYSGICVGWGWTKQTTVLKNNIIQNNEVHHFAKRLFAAGGIYTLSAQPNTVIKENYIHDMVLSPYMQDPGYCYYIYLDGASSHIEVRDNWCPEEKFGTNNNGPNTWHNNGPAVDEKIKNQMINRNKNAKKILNGSTFK